MAAVVGSEDGFRCSICLNLFKDPVSTPCGHNFCQTCITNNWNLNYHKECPLCKERYHTLPTLKTNTLVSDLVAKIRSSQKAQAGPGDISCDVCPELKLKAVKSCVDCVASYCQNHLDPHLTVPRLKVHELIGPVHDFEPRLCPEHDQPLRCFCRTDQSLICYLCRKADHRSHKVSSLKEEWEQRKVSLNEIQTKCQNMVEQRREMILMLEQNMELSLADADYEASLGVQAFTALMQHIQTSRDQFLDRVEEKKKQTEKKFKNGINKLKQEIHELEKRQSEMEKFMCSDDYFHLLQHCSAVTSPAGLVDWSTVTLKPEIEEEQVTQALSELKEYITAEMNKCDLEKVQQYRVDICLDPATAHANLALSADLKEVHHTDVKKTVPYSLLRFTVSPAVLGKQSFFKSKFYYEVQVSGKTEWYVGVALESVNRAGIIDLSPSSGYWSIALREGKYFVCGGTSLVLRSAPQKVGVFVDYKKGLVSFYDVDTADLIHSFTGCRFTGILLHFCCPGINNGGTNSSPLVLETQLNPPKKQKL